MQRLAFGQSPEERAAEVAPPAALGSAPGCPQTLLTLRDRGTRGHIMKGSCLPLRCPLWHLPRMAWWDEGSGAGSITTGQMSPARANSCRNQPQSSRSFLVAEESWSSRTRSPDGGTRAPQGWKELRATWWLWGWWMPLSQLSCLASECLKSWARPSRSRAWVAWNIQN